MKKNKNPNGINSKKRVRKNNPSINDELKKLQNTPVTIRYRDKCIFLQFQGKLEFHTLYETYGIWLPIKSPKYGSYINYIKLRTYNIKKIDNNIIELAYNSKNVDFPSQNIYEISSSLAIAVSELPYVKIYINGINMNLMGKLKYNRKDDLYYIQNSDLSSICTFRINCVNHIYYNSITLLKENDEELI